MESCLVILTIAILAEEATGFDTPRSCIGDRISSPDHYWSRELKRCLPCTRCNDLQLVTLNGCAPNKDTVCGTIEDLRHQWLAPQYRRSPSPTSEPEVPVVYGQAQYGPKTSSGRRRYSATRRVKENVRNASQRKSEFLKKLQEEEQVMLPLPAKKKSLLLAPQVDNSNDNSNNNNLDGQIRFSADDNKVKSHGDLLHQDLEMIERELLNETFPDQEEEDEDVESYADYVDYGEEVTTPKAVVAATPPSGQKDSYGQVEVTVATTQAASDEMGGQKRFFPPIEYEQESPASSHAHDVFGAVIQDPSHDPEHNKGYADEFNLLTSLLYRHSNDAKNSSKPSSSENTGSSFVLRLEHGLVVVGFLIGFCFVFGIGLIYTKVHQMRRFKLLDNGQGGEASLLSSRNSSIHRGGGSNDSRQSSHTTSPLVSQAHSPQGVLRPLQQQPQGDVRILNESENTHQHSAYVDQRGRTVLRPARELPV